MSTAKRLRPSLMGLLFTSIFLSFGVSHASAAPASASTSLLITSEGTETHSVEWGKVVTLTATVKTAGTALPQGQVNFCDAAATYCTDIHILGTAPLNSAGTAVFKFIPGSGSHSYRAELAGAKGAAASSSVITDLTVTPAVVQALPSATTISPSGSVGNYTLTATVTGYAGSVAPTGTVSFLDTSNANAVLGTAPLLEGKGTSGLSWTNSQTPTTKVGPQSIVTGDFNGDGKADIAVETPGFVSLLIGNGDGTFTGGSSDDFAVLAGNQVMVAAPFMTVGPPDILIFSNSSSTTNDAQMIYGNGTGGETVGTPFSSGLVSVSAVATGDFNGDGKQDFVAAGLISGTSDPAIAIVLGNGDGTFGSPTIVPQSDTVLAIGVGNFLGNGRADIAVMTALTGTTDLHTVSTFGNDGHGNFSPGPSISESGDSPVAMVVADFNADGNDDLAIANSGDDSVTILTGVGNGTFNQLASPQTGSSPSSIAVGDFDGDKVPDLAVANSGDNTVTILLGNNNGTFTASTSPATGTTPVSLAAGDFNGGGTSDLAVANTDNSTNGSVSVLVSQAGLTSTATATGIAVVGTGAHLVEASYPGDTIYAASLSGTTSLSAQAASPTITLTANPTSSSPGQQVLLTATLSPYSVGAFSTNGETVTFLNGTGSIGTGTLSSGVATLNTTSLPAGTDSLTAAYAGDTNFNAITSLALSFTVSSAGVNLSTNALTFDAQLAGTTSAAQMVTLTNSGTATLSITSISASSPFAETNTCGSSVAASGNCTISVTLMPTTGGSLTGTLTITDNASDSPQTVTLSGTGTSVGVTSGSGSLTIPSAGGSATATIHISSAGGFSGTVNLTCTVTYEGSGTSKDLPTCGLSPQQGQVSVGSPLSSTLTVSTTGTSGTARSNRAWLPSGAALAVLFFVGFLPRRRWKSATLLAFLAIAAACTTTGCSSAAANGTTTGDYQVVVTATSATVTASTTIPLTLQ